MKTAPLSAAGLVVVRDLRLAFRKPSQLVQPLSEHSKTGLVWSARAATHTSP